MDFVDDVDFVFAGGGSDDGLFAELADIVDTGVGSGVDFDDVEVIIFDGIIKTIDSVCENAGYRCLAGATGANEEIGVADFALGDGAR